jgi:hypothetical protein
MFNSPGSREGRFVAPRVRSLTTNHIPETDLFAALLELTGFRQTWHVRRPGIALMEFKAETKHRNLVAGVVTAVGFVYHRFGATPAACAAASLVREKGAETGLNIYDITDHYGNLDCKFTIPVAVGYHQFAVWLSADTTTPHTDGECVEMSNDGSPTTANNSLSLTIVEGGRYG